jgi:hypothetical protein
MVWVLKQKAGEIIIIIITYLLRKKVTTEGPIRTKTRMKLT